MAEIFGPPSFQTQPVDFSWLANLPNQFYQGAQQKQQYDLSHAFPNGVPMVNGQPDAKALMQIFAANGDIADIPKLAALAQQQQQTQQAQQMQKTDPDVAWLSGGGSGGSEPSVLPPAPLTSNPPASAAAAIPTTASTPGDQIGVAPSIDELAAKAGVSGTVAANIAKAVKVAPDAPLTAEQWQKAQTYLKNYLARNGNGASNGASDPVSVAGQRVASIESGGRYDAIGPVTEDGDRAYGKYGVMGKNIPEWTKEVLGTALTPQQFLQDLQAQDAVFRAKFGQDVRKTGDVPDAASTWLTGRPLAQGGATAADQNGMTGARYASLVSGAPPSAGAVSQAPTMAPQGGGQQPLVPHVPLPPQFKNDPQGAILWARAKAASLLLNPASKPYADMFAKYADRIEASLNPVEVTPTESILDPRTGKPLYQGAYMSGAGMLSGPALDQAAEAYYQTGKTPTNMGRGMQGAAGMNAVITRATELHPDDSVSAWPARWQQFKTQGGYTDEVKNIADAIKSGDQPPILTGLYRLGGPVRAQLEKDGVDLSQMNLEWQRAVKQVASLNGPQMTRFFGLAQSVENTIDEVRRLSDQMENSGIPLANRAKLTAYIQAEGNSANGQLAARYIGAINTLKEEFANLAQGSYAPTEATWALANRQIDENYGVKELNASLDEVERLIKYRLNAMPGIASLGPGAPNQYTGTNGGQQPQTQAPPSQQSAPNASQKYINPKTGAIIMRGPDGNWITAN